VSQRIGHTYAAEQGVVRLATKAELEDVLGTGVVGGGPSMMYATQAFSDSEEFSA
jgi:hypothetical protein